MNSKISHQALRSNNIYFGGCDYLGLSQHFDVKTSVIKAIGSYGMSVGASRVTSGTLDVHHKCESLIATICGTEKSVLLPSGFLANVAVAEIINHKNITCLAMEGAHPSFLSALDPKLINLFSTNELLINAACYLEDLGKPYFIYIDAVNSVTYEKAPVANILSIARYGCVIIDESHIFGLNLPFFHLNRSKNIVVTSSLSKAVGQFGGFVAGNIDYISCLEKNSGAFRAATPLPAAICYGIISALEICANEDLILKLNNNLEYFWKKMSFDGKEFRPVYCFYGLVENAISTLYKKLLKNGIYIPYIEQYGEFRGVLRVAICANHLRKELDDLVSILKSFSDVITLDPKLTIKYI